jgi:hypothetical protein
LSLNEALQIEERVNKSMMRKHDRVIKAQWDESEQITAWAGLGLVERLACRTRLWSDCRRFLPARCKSPEAGYDSTSVAASIIHGLLSGSQGTYAAEPLRADEPLRRLLGLEDGAPEEATVYRALGQWADAGGIKAVGCIQRRQVKRLIERTAMPEMMTGGFFPVFGDATWLEVGRETRFEGKKTFDGTSKLMLSTLWVGPYWAGQSFAEQGTDERAATERLIEPVWRDVLKPLKLADRTLFLLDSLYGDGPFLEALEQCRGSRYIVGANKLTDVARVAAEQPESQWINTGARRKWKWAESGVCVHTYQAEPWKQKRTVVTRRYKPVGEMFWRYASVLTNLEPEDPRLTPIMDKGRGGYAKAIWKLYDYKQAMENQFKDPLQCLGLHHPPCRELKRNEMFYAMGALALNLAVGLRQIALMGPERSMRLWRLRREFFAIAGRVATHARCAVTTLFGSSARIRALWMGAMARIEAG